MGGTRFSLEVRPSLPPELERLNELANDLYYSWDRSTRRLFALLDPGLWEACLHNPGIFLRRVSQTRLEEAAADHSFLADYHQTLRQYDDYRAEVPDEKLKKRLDAEVERVAFFCAEFGFHESLPIYSGGLGILAGDYCKGASDLGIPFVAVGLLYHQGNLTQEIDAEGNQITHYTPINIDNLPIRPAEDAQGREVLIELDLPERRIAVKVWRARAGHIELILLDTDTGMNDPADRAITHQLYTSDTVTRLQQAMVLGIGGVRALEATGLTPSIWHINEGLPALQIIERCRHLVRDGLDFSAALEIVAASTIFTTHTPVPAGHEIIESSHLTHHLDYVVSELGITTEQFLNLGRSEHDNRFNFTTFCLRGSRFHNGVSKIHGHVAASLAREVWPEIPIEENPLTWVTNGIHVPTFLANEWTTTFEDSNWGHEMLNPDYWSRIDRISDDVYWQTHADLKAQLINEVLKRIRVQSLHRGCSEAEIQHQLRRLAGAEEALVLGFARRFATYKRATLLFEDSERLARLLGDIERPVIILMAGKAHQADGPGQDLIREIHRYSEDPRFRGKVVLLEGYDLALARKMLSGVDVWLNLPEYPLEACGTSGQKAGINGVLNLSILDGWWPEGFDGENGWGIEPHIQLTDMDERNAIEAKELLDLLEEKVIPLYFNDRKKWIGMSKASMRSLLPQFNAQRMVMDYVDKLYELSWRIRRKLTDNDNQGAIELARWKQRIRKHWPQTSIHQPVLPPPAIKHDEDFELQVAVTLGGLGPEDIVVECLIGLQDGDGDFEQRACYRLDPGELTEGGEILFGTAFSPPMPGLQDYYIRMYPYHRLLSHPFELGFMKWV